MADAKYIAGRVQMMRTRDIERDANHRRIIAMRKGKYNEVAPGLFNDAEFGQPLVANLIDTTARDVAEVMAPLPSFNCQPATLSNDTDQKRQDMRGAVANAYVQSSRLQDQMFGGADRYGSFGYMAYIVQPDLVEKMPLIRVDTSPAYYVKDYRGRVKQYAKAYRCSPLQLCFEYPEARAHLEAKYGSMLDTQTVEVVVWHDDESDMVVLTDCNLVLQEIPNRLGKCPVRVVERPDLMDDSPRGQFDDVIWVQVARAVVQMYTMNALDRAVNAPMVVPNDVQEVDIGPFATIQTDNPQQVGYVNLTLPSGLFPEAQMLQQEQRTGSRYPEGRSGSTDASIITGAGVQALMGTFDTQVQTFQRLNTSALEDVIAMCFEMDEVFWPSAKKTCRIKDNGAQKKFDYVPTKDIGGDYSIDVSYGAIAGLDPNRGLVFVLQALAGGLISKQTARKSLPVDMNPLAEERQIDLEGIDAAAAAAIQQLPLALAQMAMGGMDPREIVLQIAQLRNKLAKGESVVDAIESVFAPKEDPAAAAAAPPDPMAALMGGAGGAGAPAGGGGGAQELLQSLAGMTAGGDPNLQSSVKRSQPI